MKLLFKDSMIVYTKNHEESILKKLLEIINKLSKVVGYAVRIQNRQYFYVLARNNLKITIKKFNNVRNLKYLKHA